MLVARPLGLSIEDALPVLVEASGAISTAATQMNAIGTKVQNALQQISLLPQDVKAAAKNVAEEAGYSAGKGFARGFGWNILLPLAVGTGLIVGSTLLYRKLK